MLIKISWRNIWRNRTRSLVIIVALVIGLMGGVFSAAMRFGAEAQQFEDTIEYQISHIQIHNPEFIANPEARFRVEGGFEMADEISKRPEVLVATPRTAFDGMISSASKSTGVRIRGIDQETEALATKTDQLVFEGSFLDDSGRLPGMVIGQDLAQMLNVRLGSRIVLTFQDIYGEVISASFRIEGLFTMNSRSFEESTVFVLASDLNEMIGDPLAVTEIAVVLNDHNKYREAASNLQQTYPSVEVRHWAEISPHLYFVMEILQQGLIWLMGIVILGVSFGVLNTILMSVLERVRELGVLMAVGMKRSWVFGMIVLETTMLSIIGGSIGLTASYLLVSFLNKRGVDMATAGGDGLREYGYASVIHPQLEPIFYLHISIVIIVFAILASLYPAWKAIRLVPAEAVRQE